MAICFLTKEKMSYDEAPPSRILNLKKILEKYQEVYVLCSETTVKEKNIFTLPIKPTNFFTNQLYKLMMTWFAFLLWGRKRISHVIVREYYYIILLYPLAKLFRTKLIYDMHCFRYKELRVEHRGFKAAFVRFFELWAHQLADHISVISQGILDDLPKKKQVKAFLLPNGVDLEYFDQLQTDRHILEKYHIPRGKHIVAFVGNWMEWVDIPTVLESSNHFSKNTLLLVVGKCYQKTDLHALRKKYPQVIFTDRIPHTETVRLLKMVDLCILPYKNVEVLKHLSIRKTLEYLAAGKPIIMSDSSITEKTFLKEGENMRLYKPGDPQDLALQVQALLHDTEARKRMAHNNKELSKTFSWEQRVIDSPLFLVTKSYDALLGSYKKGHISIIIKALNEQQHIKASVESALAALKGLDGEVILADSLSTDKTIELAKKYPIKIVQLTSEKDRCCGVGPQMGYLQSKGQFVYILDADMVLDKDFLRHALPYFHHPTIAGVGGNIFEKSKENLAFQVRSKSHIVSRTIGVDQLGMGGMYRRSALQEVGYFSNPRFYAYEEYDLGAELTMRGCELIRIPKKMIDHYGDITTPLATLWGRLRSKYLYGSGQYLRRSLFRGHFFKTLWELRIYVFTLAWVFLGVASLIAMVWTTFIILAYLLATLLFLTALAVRKMDIRRTAFSIFSWNFQAFGMLLGLFVPSCNPKKYCISMKVVQDG